MTVVDDSEIHDALVRRLAEISALRLMAAQLFAIAYHDKLAPDQSIQDAIAGLNQLLERSVAQIKEHADPLLRERMVEFYRATFERATKDLWIIDKSRPRGPR